jgi:MOSC domain-containing protein YiiM
VVSDPFEVVRLLVSPGHNFFGHHGEPPAQHPMIELAAVRCLAGRGLEGDRFLDYKPDNPGQITFFAEETLLGLAEALGLRQLELPALRRNVLTRGGDLPALIGREFTVQGVRFAGVEECRPCYWMNQAVSPGAEAWLRGRGGLRARILSDGVLRVRPKEIGVGLESGAVSGSLARACSVD